MKNILIILVIAVIIPFTISPKTKSNKKGVKDFGNKCFLEAYTNQETEYFSSPKSGKPKGSFPGSSTIEILDHRNGWFLVISARFTIEGNEEFIKKSKYTEEDGITRIDNLKVWIEKEYVSINAKSSKSKKIPLYSKPGASGKVIAHIPVETELPMTSCSNDWAEVKYEEKTGWIDRAHQCGDPLTNCQIE